MASQSKILNVWEHKKVMNSCTDLWGQEGEYPLSIFDVSLNGARGKGHCRGKQK